MSIEKTFCMKLKENSTIKIITGGEAKVLKELGAGGQGTVYKVHYGGKDYALKWYHKARQTGIL